MSQTFEFPAPVLLSGFDMMPHHIPIPPDIADELVTSGTRRVIATLNGKPFRRAIMSNGDGVRFVVTSRAILKEIDAIPGDMVMVSICTDPEPDRIDLGEEFEAVLEQDAEARQRFESMTPGRRRGLAGYITSAKRTETRVTRALEIAKKLRTRTLYSDRESN